MIDTFRLRRAGLGLALLLSASLAAAAEWNVGQLMHTLAQNKSGKATFVEKKYIALLDKPVESSGELFYVAPDRLEKRTLKPKAESMVLEQGTLTVEQGRKKYSVTLQDYPEVAAFVESIRGTLAGDRQSLERVYRLDLDGSAERWQLTLFPSDAKMAGVISKIRISGARNDVHTIEIVQADGDRSVMNIDKVVSQ
jgi:outer membrane lipoprotein carrier protein LolA